MVKCADCGFVGVRLQSDGQLTEADEHCRTSGKIRQNQVNPPVCCASCTQFSNHADHRLEQFTQQRHCATFVQWHPGFTPKEHADRMLSERLLESRKEERERERQWREEQATIQAESQETQANRDGEWRQEDIKLTKGSMRTTVITSIVVGLLSCAATLGAVILAWYLSSFAHAAP